MRNMTCLLVASVSSAIGLRSEAAPVQEDARPAAFAHPLLPSHGRDLSDFVPQGWKVEAQTRGQLGNPARWADAFVLIKPDQSTSESDERVLAVAFESASGGYDLAAENHTFLPALQPTQRRYFSIGLGMGRTMPALAFRRGSLVVNVDQTFEAGPNADRVLTYSLRYLNGRLVLVSLEESIVTQRGESVNNSYNFLSGKALVFGANCAGVADVEAGCRYKPTWRHIAPKGLPVLDQLGSWYSFKPKVE